MTPTTHPLARSRVRESVLDQLLVEGRAGLLALVGTTAARELVRPDRGNG